MQMVLLTLLSMARLRLKDVMGYCVLYCLGGGVILSLALGFSNLGSGRTCLPR